MRPDLQTERHESLLRAVVQVALQPAALLVARLHDAHARGLDLLQLQAHLDPQARDLDRERGGGQDLAQRDAALQQGRVVQQHRRARALARDLRARPAIVRQRRDELAGGGRVGLAGRQPEEQLGQRIAQRLGEHVADLLGGTQALAHLVLEGLDRVAGSRSGRDRSAGRRAAAPASAAGRKASATPSVAAAVAHSEPLPSATPTPSAMAM